jgi:hypothetical protein
MAEVWVAAVVTIGGGIIAGQAAEKKDKSDKAYSTKNTKLEARLNAQQSGYEAALSDFYIQKDRYEKQRGLDQFRQFSTMDQFAPGVNDQGGRVVMPQTPDYNSFAPYEAPTPPAEKKKKKKLTGLLAHDLGLI